MSEAASAAPMFSVIVPCRDDQSGLDEALESICRQTLDDLEVVVVDDGSRPPITVLSDPRIRLVRRESAGGPAAARNAGLDAARGRIIAFCDSDDVFQPRRLERAMLAHESSELVVCEQVWEHSASDGNRPRRPNPLHTTSPHLGATTILRSLCPRFDESYLASQDVEWWVRIVKSGIPISFVREADYTVRKSDRPRVLNSAGARLEFSYQLLQDHDDYFRTDRAARSFRWTRIAAMEREGGNRPLARRAIMKALRSLPTSLALREFARQLMLFARSPAPMPLRISDERIPPISSARGRQLSSLRCGTNEGRLRPHYLPAALTSSLTASAPRVLRGRARRASVLPSRSAQAVRMGSAWGHWFVEPTATRLISPYVDEVLETALVARLLQPGMRVVDIGANRGWYTLVSAARVGEKGSVISVEPDQRMTPLLRRLIDENDLHRRVRIEECAIADRRGEIRFQRSSEAALSHIIADHTQTGETGSDLTSEIDIIEAISFGELLEMARWSSPDFVKLDVEGAEPLVLRSLVDYVSSTKSVPPVVMFEFEPEHYARSGFSWLDASAGLSRTHDLYSVDYSAGGLVPISSADPPSSGRNVFAVPIGDREALSRMMMRVP